MPLVRFQVRNEFGLGQPELHTRVNKEDPKAVLDGVAVAGLVGILRQLGDLAEFAAEVFHGLQEQVMTTASRSHKLMVRVQHMEAALPPLEKIVLAQTSHIHFAYTAGSEWHPRIRNERNHFIYNDLPHFIMDSYEECRGPPRLHLLDKFDTGGPGSCLKRYSDPTLFKRSSTMSDEANAEKVQRDRKARRSKKKRSSKQSGDVSRGASVSDSHNSSMRFIPPIVDGRSSPSQTASTVDMGIKYDLGDRLSSFDSRAESGYIECVFHPSSSMQAGEQESKDSPSFKLSKHDDNLDSVFSDEHVGFTDDNFPRSSLQEQITSGSSCVTWDEKAEIMELKSQESGMDETLDLHQNKSDIDAHGCGAGDIRTVDQMQMLGGENIQESVSSRNEIDEVESEPDNYEDALNTIESESENDLDYQTKRELERFSSIVNDEETDGMHELTMHCSDLNPPSHAASFISTNKEVLSELADSVSSESCDHEQMPSCDISSNKEVPSDLPSLFSPDTHACVQMSPKASEFSTDHSAGITRTADILDASFSTDHSAGITRTADILDASFSTNHSAGITRTADILDASFSTDHSAGITRTADILDASEVDSAAADPSSSVNRTTDVQDPLGDKTISTVCKSEESHADISSNHSIKFWTNGGLLGLMPSKPPDFTMSSAGNQDSVNGTKTDTVGPLNHTYVLKDEVHGGKLIMSAEKAAHNEKDSSSMCSTSCRDDKDGVSTEKTSHRISSNFDSAQGNAGDVHMHNEFSNARVNDVKETSLLGTGQALPVASNAKYTSSGTNHENDENSSLVFGLSRRLLSNGFGRKVSDVNDGKCEPASLTNDSVLEQRSELHRVAHQRIPETVFKEQFGFGYPVHSPSSSPPLEHMKISFRPVDSFETSKLKLKFSDGTQSHESIGDMFPSFQLIPEPAIPLHNYGSDSDDDTFCRSPLMSDDCLSQHSESNSEQWECGETTEGKDHEIYDALCGISSMERISSSLELDGITNGGICFDRGIKSANVNGVEPSLCNPILDLPSFDAVKPAIQQDTKDDANPKNQIDLRCPVDPAPTPPPLPPVQWRVSKPQLDGAEQITCVASEDFKHILGAKLLGSTTSQQPEPASAGQPQTNEEPIVKPKSKVEIMEFFVQQEDQPKLNGQKEVNHGLNGKGMDEREDFLQQIRTKSFNLRRTVTAKTTTTPGPAANNKVTAILEKANAIRQAVGSDDGEDDDNWSDA